MKTVFFGSSEYVIPILEVLKDKFGLFLIVTTEKQGSVVEFAKNNDISFLSSSKISSKELEQIKNTDADVGIVADFGLILTKNAIDSFPRGILNVHPSLLPRYRGPTPVQTAILNGDKQTGVTIFKIDEKMDHGPILAQEEFEIVKDQTAKDLFKILFKLGASFLEKTLIDYIEEAIQPAPQDEQDATITKLLGKQDGLIEINKPPEKQKLSNMIRAYFPWPGVWFHATVNGQSSIVKLLPNNMVQVEGKNPQSFKDFLNGYKEGKEILGKLKL